MSVNYTPRLGDYTALKPFRYWCQKVLPLVYEDSLSYYELLCKVVDYLNKTMEDVETLHEDTENLHSAYEQLQSYVNDYFDNLDVQDEIDNKLDDLVKDGTFATVIEPIFSDYASGMTSRMNLLENRMDTFSSLSDGATSGDAELADIRVGYNSVTYNSAGNAVRTQIQNVNNALINTTNELNSDITEIDSKLFEILSSFSDTENALPTKTTANTYWNDSGDTAVITELSGQYRAVEALEVNANEMYYITITTGTSTNQHGVVFADENYSIISRYCRSSAVSVFNVCVIVPANAKYMLLTTVNYATLVVRRVLLAMNSNISNSIYLFNNIKNVPINSENIEVTLNENNFWSTEQQKATLTSYTGYYQASNAIPVEEGEIYDIKIRGGNSGKQNTIILTDSSYNILYKYGRISGDLTTRIVVGKGCAYLLLNFYNSGSKYLSLKKVTFNFNETNYYLKNISIMGDSISAYTGTIPSGNSPYYTGSNAGVNSPDQMWWKVVCDRLGANPLIINGWSGSLVTSGIRPSIKEASHEDRCSNLGTNNASPDIIIIAMGVNDYSYNAPIGNWDGTSDNSDDTTTFKSAYATMLKRIQTNYPNALIVCLTPWFMQRGSFNGITYTNSLGLNVEAYSQAIREIASIMRCPVIDTNYTGFNNKNYYPTYCNDSSTIPTHPNANGQLVMGETVAQELKKICKGFVEN